MAMRYKNGNGPIKVGDKFRTNDGRIFTCIKVSKNDKRLQTDNLLWFPREDSVLIEPYMPGDKGVLSFLYRDREDGLKPVFVLEMGRDSLADEMINMFNEESCMAKEFAKICSESGYTQIYFFSTGDGETDWCLRFKDAGGLLHDHFFKVYKMDFWTL